MGTPPCEQTNKVKLLPSRRTTYAGGNNHNIARENKFANFANWHKDPLLPFSRAVAKQSVTYLLVLAALRMTINGKGFVMKEISDMTCHSQLLSFITDKHKKKTC